MRSQWVLLFYGYCIHICINPAFTWCFDLKTQLFNIFLHAEIRWGDFFTQWNYYDFSKLGIHSVYVCVAFTLAETFGVTFRDGWGAEFHAAEHPQYNVGVTTGDPCMSFSGQPRTFSRAFSVASGMHFWKFALFVLFRGRWRAFRGH